MARRVVLLLIPQVRRRDITPGAFASLDRLSAAGAVAELHPVFPSLSATAFATVVTGAEPTSHGIVASAFLDRAALRVVGPYLSDAHTSGQKLWEWTATTTPGSTSMTWFAPNSSDAAVDFSAVIDDDGTLRTRPVELADELVRRFGPFPGPLGGPPAAAPRLETTAWAIRTAAHMLETHAPTLAIIRLPHVGHVARRFGPDSRDAARAIRDLDRLLGPFIAAASRSATVVAATESIAGPVGDPVDINRILRNAGLLNVAPLESGGTDVDIAASGAVAVAEHQVCHVYVNHRDAAPEVAAILANAVGDGIDIVVQGNARQRVAIAHERTGDLVLVAEPDRWFRGDWWRNPQEAPRGRCPSGLDSASLHLVNDPARVNGSIGAPPTGPEDLGMIAVSDSGLLGDREVLSLIEVAPLIRNALLT